MHILIHTDEYCPTNAACANRMRVFAEVFSSLGHQVTVIASSTNKKNGTVEGRSERIIFSPALGIGNKSTLRRMLNNLSFAFTSVISSFRVSNVDIVITSSPPPLISISGWLIAKLKHAKLVYDVRDIWPDVAIEMGHFSENSFYGKMFNKITRFMCSHADIVTTVSHGKVEKLQAKLDKNPNNKIWLVANGFDDQVLNCKLDYSIIDEFSLEKNFTVVYIGNIGLAQGLDSILTLAREKRNENIKFLLFGDGAERAKIKEIVEKEQLSNVQICGVIAHDKVYTILSKANISFIPLKSSKMRDSIPTKLYEALGIGCPVLLLADGESCEILQETGLGKSVSLNQISMLPEVFRDMVDNYGQYYELRSRAQTIMKNRFSRRQVAKEFERRLQELIS